MQKQKRLYTSRGKKSNIQCKRKLVFRNPPLRIFKNATDTEIFMYLLYLQEVVRTRKRGSLSFVKAYDEYMNSYIDITDDEIKSVASRFRENIEEHYRNSPLCRI